MLSLNAPLVVRINYDLPNVSQDELLDAAAELAAFQEIAETPADLQEQLDELETWRDIRIDGMRHDYESADYLEARIGQYVEFFNDCVSTVEEYYGSFMGTEEPYSFHQYIAEEFKTREEYKTVLINLRAAIAAGESLDYLASLIPATLEA